MARARNIKPGFFKNEELAELAPEHRLLFIGLWTLADREGRMEDRPRRIKMELFAYDSFDVDAMLNELQARKFLIRYSAGDNKYIHILNFVKHQDPHYREKASVIPAPTGLSNCIAATNVTRTQRQRIYERDEFTCKRCGSTEHLSIDHIVPISKGGDSSDSNLQVLCYPCNYKKGVKVDSTTEQPRVNVDSTLKDEPEASLSPAHLNPDSLIPDSLNRTPDSGLSDSLNPESGKERTASARKPAFQMLGFNEFWLHYPRKGKKPAAEEQWSLLAPDPDLRVTILASLEDWKQSRQWSDKNFIPMPEKWLKQRQWEDEVPRETTSNGGTGSANEAAVKTWLEGSRPAGMELGQ